MAKVYVGDISTKIRLDAGVDITEATVLEIHYTKPDGTKGVWTALPEDSNYGYYLTVDGDLDENGVWEVQLYVELGGWKGHGEITSFSVFETL